MPFKIFFSNIGYARGIDGTLWQHVIYSPRHFYQGVTPQQQVLLQLKEIILKEDPDICCFVEIDNGSIHSAYYNQLDFLVDRDYMFFDIANKYGEGNWLNDFSLFKGRCNAFLSKKALPFERLYFKTGSKRLVYKLVLPGDIVLFFAHFSLQKKTRLQQFDEFRQMVSSHKGNVIVLTDFNVMKGFGELDRLVKGTDLRLLSGEENYTFVFHRLQLALDLCLCSNGISESLNLKIIPQPFSDHAALLLECDF